MTKWIIRPHRSSPYMLAFERTCEREFYYWARDKKNALMFNTRTEAVQAAFKANQKQYAVKEIEV